MSEQTQEPKVVEKRQVDGQKVVWVEATRNKYKNWMDLQINEPYENERTDGLRYGRANVRVPMTMALTVLREALDVYNESMGTNLQIVES